MKQKVTLRNLADATGVHPSTVSRVLRGEDGRASAETKDRVFEAAERLGYQPDFSARSLRTRRSLTLGLIIPDIRDAVFASIYVGAERAAQEHGYHVLLFPVGATRRPQKEQIDFLTERAVDGALIATAKIRDPLPKQLEQARIPFVLVNRRTANQAPYVVGDDETGGFVTTRHLIDLGHRRIGFVAGTRGVSTTEGRLSGYRSALVEADLCIDEQLIVGTSFDIRAAAKAVRSLLDLPELPTAIVVADDMMAIAVCRMLTNEGLRIPEDISVTGYNDLPVAALIDPPLTTVHNHLGRMGEQAAKLLMNRLAGQEPEENVTLTAKLVVRRSSGTPR
jgi:LacI family transcriptional regulator